MPKTPAAIQLIADTLSDATTPFEALSALAELAPLVDDLTHMYARRARALGYTWSLIGEALGVTASAAQQRFGKAAGN
jgi:hypothetical protein